MSNDAVFYSDWSRVSVIRGLALLLLWFATVYYLGREQLFASQPGQALRPVLLTIALPVALFLGAYFSVPKFKHFVLAQDLRVLTILQSWRVIGFAFLLLYAHQVLPGLFAWPAGIGDLAVGLAAPWIAIKLARRADYAQTRSFLWFHLLGMLDFVVAAITASLASGAFPLLHSGLPNSAPMEVWPLIVFPAFLVPLFLCLHLAALLKLAHKPVASLAIGRVRPV